jgi:hypothetical protein
MKTPREILLGRHKAAEAKLDAIRHSVLTEIHEPLARSNSSREESVPFAVKLWQELILPARRIWLGLAATWLVVFAFNLVTPEDRPLFAAKPSALDVQTLAELKQQKLLMAQLLDLNDAASTIDADRPKYFAPRPRSEIPLQQMIG